MSRKGEINTNPQIAMLQDSKITSIRGHPISERNVPESERREGTKGWESRDSVKRQNLVYHTL